MGDPVGEAEENAAEVVEALVAARTEGWGHLGSGRGGGGGGGRGKRR